MKNNIRITNLTQVHIGSGETLQKDMDFIVRRNGEYSDIYIIDPDRVGEIIGTDQRVLSQWIASIEKGDTNSFFDLFLKRSKPADYSKRCIPNYAGDRRSMTLKEFIHDGTGKPYIPGSSLKGAIRTAIIAFLASKMPETEKERIVENLAKNNGRYQDEFGTHRSAEDVMLGDSPNESLMRFIRVGDAYYDKGVEMAVTQVFINQTKNSDNLIDKKRAQPVEVIGAEETSSFSLAIDKKKFDDVFAQRNNNKNKDLKGMKFLPTEISTITGLFKVINDHTRRLVESEISYWRDLTQYQGAEKYIEEMENILNAVNACKDGECVMRVGQATGWRFITGAWTECLKNFKDKVVPNARPHNRQKYEDYDFPKTRRMDDESYLFGFVKLSSI